MPKYSQTMNSIIAGILISTSLSRALVVFQVSTHNLYLQINETAQLSVSLSAPLNSSVSVFLYVSAECNMVKITPHNRSIPARSTKPVKFIINPVFAGETVIFIRGDFVNDSRTFVRLSMSRNHIFDIIGSIIGWIYFFSWSFSFYPQIYLNWKRKSVIGLNFDYLAINTVGFLTYSVYNVCFKYFDGVQKEYKTLNPTGVIPVEVNDIAFALHVTFASFVLVFQCVCYEKGNQKMSRLVKFGLGVVSFGTFVYLVIIFLQLVKNQPWLNFLYYLSYIKLASTLTKYTPQAYLNFQRKSTEGWSIVYVFMDVTGGLLSVGQMLLLAYNYNDWKSIFGNFAKFGLGVVSISYDVLFMIQHYCLYRESSRQSYQRLPEEDIKLSSSNHLTHNPTKTKQ